MSAPTQSRQSERAFQAAVLELARRTGWVVAHFSDSRRQVRPGVHVGDRDAAGFPDLVLVRERVIFAELKGPKTRVTPLQHRWLTALRDAGAETYLWRPDDWQDIQTTLTHRRTP